MIYAIQELTIFIVFMNVNISTTLLCYCTFFWFLIRSFLILKYFIIIIVITLRRLSQVLIHNINTYVIKDHLWCLKKKYFGLYVISLSTKQLTIRCSLCEQEGGVNLTYDDCLYLVSTEYEAGCGFHCQIRIPWVVNTLPPPPHPTSLILDWGTR